MFEFASTLWLLAIPLPWVMWMFMQRRPPSLQKTPPAQAGLLHPHTELLHQLTRVSATRRPLPLAWALACVLLIVVLARPQWILFQNADHPGRDFMLAIDVSDSMHAQDYIIDNQAVSRLDMVKRLVTHLFEHSHGDRAGLIVFGDDAFLAAPVTADLMRVRAMLTDIQVGIAGNKTALGNAVALAVKHLRERPAPSRLLVLLTDGTNTAGEVLPPDALRLAQQYGVRIYAVGIGSHGKVLYPRGPVQDPKLTEIPLDEALLQDMARQTGGHYYRASRAEDAEKIIADINRIETIPIADTHTAARQEWYWLPLLFGLSLMFWAQRRAAQAVLP